MKLCCWRWLSNDIKYLSLATWISVRRQRSPSLSKLSNDVRIKLLTRLASLTGIPKPTLIIVFIYYDKFLLLFTVFLTQLLHSDNQMMLALNTSFGSIIGNVVQFETHFTATIAKKSNELAVIVTFSDFIFQQGMSILQNKGPSCFSLAKNFGPLFKEKETTIQLGKFAHSKNTETLCLITQKPTTKIRSDKQSFCVASATTLK